MSPGPAIRPSEIRSFLGDVKRLKAPGILVIGGSLPEGCPRDFHSQVGHLAQEKSIGIAVDVPSKFMPAILDDRSLEILFIKPNLTELQEWVHSPLKTDSQIRDALRKLAARVGIACVSLGKEGAYFAIGDRIWKGTPPDVRVRGTVGAGDSMVGAMCARLIRHKITLGSQLAQILRTDRGTRVMESIFRWGLAAGAATAGSEGTTLGKASEIKKLYPLANITEL